MSTQAEIGARIRQAREHISLSQEDFAVAVGKDQRAISEYENGKRKIAAADLENFGHILLVPVSYFFDGELKLDSLDQLMLHEMRKLPSFSSRQAAIKMIQIFVAAVVPQAEVSVEE